MVKNLPANAGLISELGRFPGRGNGHPFQYSCLGNSMDRGAWLATVHGVTKNWTQLTEHTQLCGENVFVAKMFVAKMSTAKMLEGKIT